MMRIITISILLFFQYHICAQVIQNDTGATSQDVLLDQDDDEEIDKSSEIVDNMFFDIFYGKPGKAAFYGLIIPGGGQIYNKKWWKLPLVYGLEGILIYRIYGSTVNYNGFQEAYLNNLNSENVPISFRGVSDVVVLKSNRDKFRKQREFSWVFFAGGHILTIFEAFIDRHLMEFDISDDLSFQPIPSAIGPVEGVTLTIPLNSSKKKPVYDVY